LQPSVSRARAALTDEAAVGSTVAEA
jgi:hypothetical protein